MPLPRAIVLRAPGTNCDEETVFAFEQAGGVAERVHVNRVIENPQLLADFQILCLPGGFSYGDDIAAGRILANQIRHQLTDALHEFHEAGKLILGICNGFQVLLKTGLLISNDKTGPLATLTWNDSGKFEDRWVHLQANGSKCIGNKCTGNKCTENKCTGNKCVFLSDVDKIELPIAHAEGKFMARDEAALAALEANGQLVLHYESADGANSDHAEPVPYPANPNGSQHNIAGICDPTGRIFGLMPHPERYLDPTHHPQWTRGPRRDVGEGLVLLQNAVKYFL